MYLKIIRNKVTKVDVKNYSSALLVGWNRSRIAHKKLRKCSSSRYIVKPNVSSIFCSFQKLEDDI